MKERMNKVSKKMTKKNIRKRTYNVFLSILGLVSLCVVVVAAVLTFQNGGNNDESYQNGTAMENGDSVASGGLGGTGSFVTPAPYEPAPTPTPEPTPPPTARLAFVGDIMGHAEQLTAARVSEGVYDFNYVFRYVAPYLQAADFTLGNLETTLVHSNFRGWPLFRSPRALAEALVNAGFDMVTTGNNHSFDAFVPGVRSTIEILNDVGLPFTGTFLTPECRDEITVVEVNGFTFAIVNMTMHKNAIDLGAYNFMVKVIYKDLVEQATIDYAMIRDVMARARALNTDFIIASPHLGIEYYGTMRRQGAGHRNDTFARNDTRWFNWVRTLELFLHEGADMVMNHHPHTLVPAEFVYMLDENGEIYRRAVVAYSLANFVSAQRTQPRETSVILYVDVSRDENGVAYIADMSYVPIWVRQHNPERAPRLCFSVLPVTSTLQRVAAGSTPDLRQQDIDRMRVVHRDVTHMFSGQPIPLEYMASEYPIYRSRRIDQFPGLPLWGTLPWY